MLDTNKPITKDLDPHLLSLYAHELWYLTASIKNKCEEIFKETPVPEKDGYIKIDPNIHSLIASVLSHAANIKKLITVPSSRGGKKSGRKFLFRSYRAQTLNTALKDVNLDEMLNPKVRNTLEHFDEYLDEAVHDLSNKRARTSPWAAYNMVLSKWEIFNPRVYPVRVYIANEKKFYNMKWSIDINKIYEESISLLKKLKEIGKFPDEEESGGLLIQFEK